MKLCRFKEKKMTDQDRVVQIWKGLWKCKECGMVVGHYAESHTWTGTPYGCCKGELEPYDRRNPSQAAYGQEQRRVVLERVQDWIHNNSMPGLSDHTALIHREKFEGFIEGLLAEREKK
jgi:hypothetical protein